MKKVFSKIVKVLAGVLAVWGAVFLFGVAASRAEAATIYSNYATGNDTTGDGSSGNPYKTFHKAYVSASSGDTLNLSGTFNWANADETGDAQYTGYSISKNLTVSGQGVASTFIQAANDSTSGTRRVLTIKNGYTVTVQNVTVRYGRNATDYNGREGGGVLVETGGALTVQDCRITQNYVNSTSWGGFGGGIQNLGTLTVDRCTIDSNFAQSQGGGVNNAYLAANTNVAYITNATIANNSTADTVATVGGAGLYVRSGTMYVTNATIAYNDAPNGTGDTTGIDIVSGATLSIKNSIVALNKVDGAYVNASSGNWFDVTNSGTLTDLGGNIYGKVNTAYSGVSFHGTSWYDLYGNGAGDSVYRLQSNASTTGSLYLDTTLADNNTLNGTQTLAITNTNSIAKNNGQSGSNGPTAVPTVDQRNQTRVSTVDIGAFEYGAVANSNPNTPYSLGSSGYVDGSMGSDNTPTLTFALSDADGSDTLKFQIQIDDSANFGSPVVDYTSALAAQGSFSFTVGQAVGSGTYATGSSSQTLSDGSYYWRVKAIDNSAAESSYAVAHSGAVAFIVDTVAPNITAGIATPSGTSVVITWSTDELSSSRVSYGTTTALGTDTALTDTSPRVLFHSVTVSSLVPCSVYYYRVASGDASGNTGNSSIGNFITTGCTSASSVSDTHSSSVTNSGGGSFALGPLSVTVPAGFAAGPMSADFQALKLNAATFFAGVAAPAGYSRIGTNVFHLNALTNASTNLTSFAAPLTVSLTYTPSDVAGIDETSLRIHRYDGAAWYELSGCTVNTTTRTVTCSASNFSDFALFGQPLAVAASASSGGAIDVSIFSPFYEPVGGASVSINKGAGVTLSSAVTLSFVPYVYTERMSVSNTPGFENATQFPYTDTLHWNLCWQSDALKTPTTCGAGAMVVYVKFFSAHGKSSKTVSSTIELSPDKHAAASQTVAASFSGVRLVLDTGTVYAVVGNKKYGFASMGALNALGYNPKMVSKADTSRYALGGVLSSAADAHPVGSWIIHKKTVYYVVADGLIPVVRWSDFVANGGKFRYLVPANKTDLAKHLHSELLPADIRVAM